MSNTHRCDIRTARPPIPTSSVRPNRPSGSVAAKSRSPQRSKESLLFSDPAAYFDAQLESQILEADQDAGVFSCFDQDALS